MTSQKSSLPVCMGKMRQAVKDSILSWSDDETRAKVAQIQIFIALPSILTLLEEMGINV